MAVCCPALARQIKKRQLVCGTICLESGQADANQSHRPVLVPVLLQQGAGGSIDVMRRTCRTDPGLAGDDREVIVLQSDVDCLPFFFVTAGSGTNVISQFQ